MEEGRIDPEPNAEWFAGNTAYNTDYAPNAIDPTIFTDAEGKMWMTYGSWSGGIYLLEIDPKTGDVIYPKSNGSYNLTVTLNSNPAVSASESYVISSLSKPKATLSSVKSKMVLD